MGCNITFIKIGYFCFTTLRHWPLWTALYELIKYIFDMARSTICWYYVGEIKTIGQQKWAFKWFHTLLFLLKNRLSYRSFISTWRKSTSSTWNVLLSDSIQLLLYTNWRIPILYSILTHSFIRQFLFFSTSSGIPSCSLHMLDTLYPIVHPLAYEDILRNI